MDRNARITRRLDSHYIVGIAFLSVVLYSSQFKLGLYEDDWNVASDVLQGQYFQYSFRPLVTPLSIFIYYLREYPAVIHGIDLMITTAQNLALYGFARSINITPSRSFILASLFASAPEISSNRFQAISMQVPLHTGLVLGSLAYLIHNTRATRSASQRTILKSVALVSVAAAAYDIGLPFYFCSATVVLMASNKKKRSGLLKGLILLWTAALLILIAKGLLSGRASGHEPTMENRPANFPPRIYFWLSVVKRTGIAFFVHTFDSNRAAQLIGASAPFSRIDNHSLMLSLLTAVWLVLPAMTWDKRSQTMVGPGRGLRWMAMGIFVFLTGTIHGLLTYTVQAGLSGMFDRTYQIAIIGFFMVLIGAADTTVALSGRLFRSDLIGCSLALLLMTTLCYIQTHLLWQLDTLWQMTWKESKRILGYIKIENKQLRSGSEHWFLVDQLPVNIGPAPIFYVETDKLGPLNNAVQVWTNDRNVRAYNISYFERLTVDEKGTRFLSSNGLSSQSLKLSFPLTVLRSQDGSQRTVHGYQELEKILIDRKPLVLSDAPTYMGTLAYPAGWRLIKPEPDATLPMH